MGDTTGVDYNQRLTIGVVVTCLLLSVLSFGLRIYARTISAAKLWYDDYWMVFVMVICFAMSACDFTGTYPRGPTIDSWQLLTSALTCTGLKYGSGQHQVDLEISDLLSFMKVCAKRPSSIASTSC